MLPVVLHCLAAQTFTDFEVIVTDNTKDRSILAKNIRMVRGLGDSRFLHCNTGALGSLDCYSSAEFAVKSESNGDFICFPSDDSYYVPPFAEIMLAAAEQNRWDLVYCNMIYDTRFNGKSYAPVDVLPKLNCIDKTGFILRRSWFNGFPGKSDTGGACKADGELIESLIARGISHGKVSDFLMVHN